jgi:hypothetical protein
MHWYDLGFSIAEDLCILPDKRDWPDVIAFGPTTHAELKRQCHPKNMFFLGPSAPDTICGIKYEIENEIPFGEFRYKKWVTDGEKRKLVVYKTVGKGDLDAG